MVKLNTNILYPRSCQAQYSECDDVSSLKESLEEIFFEMGIDSITFKQWESTDRTKLVTHKSTITEFVKLLFQKLQALKLHQFINNQQTKYFYEVKRIYQWEQF